MSKPIVAIVGRPNVGKSTLFNSLAGGNISIVKDTPGVTRDRIYADIEWLGRNFTLIDTGGIEPDSSDVILSQMREQAQIAIDTADVIIFITDVRQGLVDSDSKVADMLRRSGHIRDSHSVFTQQHIYNRRFSYIRLSYNCYLRTLILFLFCFHIKIGRASCRERVLTSV